jgi:hypothetical protein
MPIIGSELRVKEFVELKAFVMSDALYKFPRY